MATNSLDTILENWESVIGLEVHAQLGRNSPPGPLSL